MAEKNSEKIDWILDEEQSPQLGLALASQLIEFVEVVESVEDSDSLEQK